MACAQQFPGLMVTPWFDKNEWIHVKNLICNKNSTESDRKEALRVLKIWRRRTQKLQSGAEGTYLILTALLEKSDNEEVLRNFYGSSILRFLNVCASQNERQGTFYKSARMNQIPSWLIDLRHDVAHAQKLPSVGLLRTGLEICLGWLKNHYWEKYEEATDSVVITNVSTDKIKELLETYCEINLVCYLNKNITQLQHVETYQPDLYTKINLQLHETGLDATTKMEEIKRALLEALTDSVEAASSSNSNLGDVVAEVLIESKSLLVVEVLGGSDSIPTHFQLIWYNLLNLLYRAGILGPLVVKILKLVADSETTDCYKQACSLWLKVLFRQLNVIQAKPDKYSGLLFMTAQNQTADESNSSNEKATNISKLTKTVEKEVLANPNAYTLMFLKEFLHFNGCTKTKINQFERLMRLYVVPQYTPLEQTFEMNEMDLQNLSSPIPEDDVEELECVEISSDDENGTNDERFRLVRDTSIFHGCPLGILPGQDLSLSNHLVMYNRNKNTVV